MSIDANDGFGLGNGTDLQKIINDIMVKVKAEKANLAYTNILVIGRTGAGKSTLINSIFKENLTETGIGEPVTSNIKLFERDSFPIKIYDTKGLELNSDNQHQVRKEVNQLVRDKLSKNNPNEYIHLIYYCINCCGNRLESTEIEWIDHLLNKKNSSNVPIILVLTQCVSRPKTDEFMDFLRNKGLNVYNTIPVLAEKYRIDNRTVESFGLNKLIQATIEVLPEAISHSFISAQRVGVEFKVNAAQKYVSNYSKAAFLTGFSPIPLSQTALLIAAQSSMLVQITNIFGMSFEKSVISSLISSLAGASSTTYLGQTIINALLKLFPASIIATGTISASTAYALTKALGYTYIKILETLVNNDFQRNFMFQEKQINQYKTDLTRFFYKYWRGNDAKVM